MRSQITAGAAFSTLVVIIGILIAPESFAGTEVPKTGGDFVASCTEPVSDTCVVQFEAIALAGMLSGNESCLPQYNSDTRFRVQREIIRKVVPWLNKRPAMLAGDATDGVLAALHDLYPCR